MLIMAMLASSSLSVAFPTASYANEDTVVSPAATPTDLSYTDDAEIESIDETVVISPGSGGGEVLDSIAENTTSEASDTQTLRDSISAELDTMLKELMAIDTANSIEGYAASKRSFTRISEIYDEVDAAFEDGSISEEEYDNILEELANVGQLLFEQYSRFGFDPYGTDTQYGYMTTNDWSAAWNGSNIIVSFNLDYYDDSGRVEYYKFLPSGINDPATSYQTHVFMDYDMLYIDAYAGSSTASAAPSSISSYYGNVTVTSFSTYSAGIRISGYITVTNPDAFAAAINYGTWKWYCGYSGSGNYSMNSGTTGIPPSFITAYQATQHTHTYAWAAVDGSTHKYYCTGCGAVSTTGSHNSGVSDTSSQPGYTIRKCSVCGYTVSTAANTYTVTLDNSGAYTSGTTSVNAVYGSAMPAITIPYRTGYSFAGFYSGANGTGTKYYSETGTSAHVYDIAGAATLYPYWVKACDISTTETAVNSFKYLGK